MRVVAVDDDLARCHAEGEVRDVEISLLDRVEPGDVLLVHADVGLVKLG
jgi:hydrogenase maturation factor